MAFNIKHIPSFGGGLNFSAHPANIADNEWAFCNGFFAKDGYAEMCVAMDNTVGTGTITGTATGVFPDPFDEDILYVTSSDDTLGYLYSQAVGGNATAITASGGFAPAAAIAGIPTATFLENAMYVCYGAKPALASGNYGVIQLVPAATGIGPASYTRIDKITNAEVPVTLQPSFITVCRDIMIGAGVDVLGSGARRVSTRTVARCDSLNPFKWVEKLWNTAKAEEWAELPWGFTGIARADENTVLFFTPDRILVWTYTGANPPFTRSLAMTGSNNIAGQVQSNLPTTSIGARGGIAQTQLGVCFRGDDNVYLWGGGPKPIASKVRQYFREKEDLTARIIAPFYHSHWGLLMIPIKVGSNYEMMMYDPLTEAWSRRVLDLSAATPVGMCYNATASASSGRFNGRWAIAISTGRVVGENATLTTPFTGAFVDTKDFHFDDPTSNDYIDRIGIDWEPLTNASTDAIQVFSSTRDDFSPTTLGSLGGDTQPSFVSEGTLTGGASELPIRRRGKFVRFRFQQSSGRARIRGFTLRWQRGSEKAS